MSLSLERGVRECDRISSRKYGWNPGDGEDRTLSANGGSARKEDPHGSLSELEWASVVTVGMAGLGFRSCAMVHASSDSGTGGAGGRSVSAGSGSLPPFLTYHPYV